MQLWHLTPDAGRVPLRPVPGDAIDLWIGTWPIEPVQTVLVEVERTTGTGTVETGTMVADWHHKAGDLLRRVRMRYGMPVLRRPALTSRSRNPP